MFTINSLIDLLNQGKDFASMVRTNSVEKYNLYLKYVTEVDQAIEEIKNNMCDLPEKCTEENFLDVTKKLLAHAEQPARLLRDGPEVLAKETIRELEFMGMLSLDDNKIRDLIIANADILFEEAKQLCKLAYQK